VENPDRDPWNKAVAAVVAASRRDEDLTQEEVAEKLGFSRNTLVAIENGSRPMTIPELMKFSKLVKLPPATLIDRIIKWRR